MIEEKEMNFLGSIAPAGFYLAIRVGFAFPVAEANTLPSEWIRRYTQRGYMMQDPVMGWVYSNTGAIRWSDLEFRGPSNVIQDARNFGLKYGLTVCCTSMGDNGLRSYGNFTRSDREFSDEEIHILKSRIENFHQTYAPPKNLTKAEIEVLVMIKDGLLMKQIADELGISLGAVKQRLKNVKSKLRAKTSSHAAALAIQFGII